MADLLISGAGIAGSAAAIALAQAGHRVRLLERAPSDTAPSSGIFVYSNGLLTLDALGVLPEILAAGYAVRDGRNLYLDPQGRTLAETRYPALDGGRIPAILGIRRADLHRILVARRAALGVPLRLASEIAALTETPGGVRVTLTDGTEHAADALIVAEGLRSTTRALAGWDVAPRYTGFGVWRSVHPRPAGIDAKILVMGAGKRFGIMPISDDRLYTFGTIPMPKDRRIDPAQGAAEMAATFADIGGPARQFLDALTPEAEPFYTAGEEVALPLPWARGRVLLSGDAAHASTPFMGQGGAMAMEDGTVLARTLTAVPDDLPAAFARFAALRYPACAFVQEASRRVGEAGAIETPDAVAARDAALARDGQAQVDGFYARLAAFRAETDAALAASAVPVP
jgi:2-polyprenyl-6-methoxyphenol hydroxylase-like FAD-dependent oxidoreductase